MRVAVVGHVEWVSFLGVDEPVHPGAILHAPSVRRQPAGGGGAAAVELARLAGTCDLFTAVGSDDHGQAVVPHLARTGVAVHAARRDGPHRQAITLVDPSGERTIAVVGPAQSPRGEELPSLHDYDAVYFCHGDAEALRRVRAARVVVATARVLGVLQEAGLALDALVHSARDPGERFRPGDLVPPPRAVLSTLGARGGEWRRASGETGAWHAATVPGAVVDTYGAGDCFAAGLTFALARGLDLPDAVELAATRGALALTRPGAGAY